MQKYVEFIVHYFKLYDKIFMVNIYEKGRKDKGS